MDMITDHLATEPKTGPIVPRTQPVGALADLSPELDDAAVRQAFTNAVANNQDPMSLTMGDIPPAPGQPDLTAKTDTSSQPLTPPDLPEKFLKPDGAVDVEKLKTSTRQLDEAIQKKEEVLKSVDDLWTHYKESQKKFGGMPNTEKIAAQMAPPPMTPQQIPDEQLRQMIARDWQADPIATTAQLIEIAVQKKLQPYEEREKDSAVRENIVKLAEKDPRVLQYFNAVTAKLNTDPDYWKLKNPHRAAWLDVKEELRLGEPSQAQAQPSRPTAPVLGGGTPPSTPSSSAPQNQDILANLDKLDLRDRRNEAKADEAIRAFLQRNSR